MGRAMRIQFRKKELNIPWEYLAAPFLIILAAVIVITYRMDNRQEEIIPVSASMTPYASVEPASPGVSGDPQISYDVPDPDDNSADQTGETEQTGQNKVVPVVNKVNINKAGMDELDTLPYIGAVKAKAIIDYRTANGPFKTVDELMNVKGIGPITLERLRPLITLE